MTECSNCGGPFIRCWCHDCCEGVIRSRCCHAVKRVVKHEPREKKETGTPCVE